MKRVFIIIANWNGKNDTLQCLASLKKIVRMRNTLAVIVVDNGSTDDSVAAIKKQHTWVTVIEAGSNLGFTGGNNLGIRYALEHNADYVWLVNNDTIIESNALSLVQAFDDPDVGLAGSKIYFAPGHEFHRNRYVEDDRGKVIWYAGGIIDWANMYASHKGVDDVDKGQYNKTDETQFVTGCSMMVKRGVFDRIGLLDDRYYLYYEDLDFCLRARKTGYKLLYMPSSVVWHVNAGSSGRPGNVTHQYYQTRNRLLIGMKYAPLRTKVALLRESLGYLAGKEKIKRKAVVDYFTGRLGKQYEPGKTNH